MFSFSILALSDFVNSLINSIIASMFSVTEYKLGFIKLRLWRFSKYVNV